MNPTRVPSVPSPPEFTARPDVRFVARSGWLYVCASTVTLRLGGAVPDQATGETEHLGVEALPEAAVEGLRRRRLLAEHGPAPAHPLYDTTAMTAAGSGVLLAGQGPLPDAVQALLTGAGIRVHPSAVPDVGDTRMAVVPLSMDETELHRWAHWAARAGGRRIVTYLSTPTRLLYAVLEPPHTPCPVCLVRRLRAHHAWQAIAGLPLDVLFGAADDDAWPTTALAAATLAHESVRSLSQPGLPVPSHLTEVDHASLERTRHRLLHTPHCPACPTGAPQAPRTDAPPAPRPGRDADPGTDWERMRNAISPLTGIVGGLRVTQGRQPGATTHAYTTGMPTTTWFSAVKAVPEGAASKGTPDNARVCALGETLERYAAGVYDQRNLTRATLAALGEAAVDPRSLPLGSAAEYARLPRYAPFHPDTEIDWVPGVSLTSGLRRYVPACAVYLPYRFPPGHRPWFDLISNGLAAGRDPEHAALGGLLELVERDAAIIFWANRLALPRLDLSGLRDGQVHDMAADLIATGARIQCKDLTTDLGIPVAGVQVVTGTPERPVVAHAARAALDLHEAVQGALEEACLCLTSVQPMLRTDGVPAPDQDLRGVMDFGRYYCAPDRLTHLRFFDDGPARPLAAPRTAPVSSSTDLTEAVERLARAGFETITVDVTPVDVDECGVSVVRAIVPGLCPLTLRRDFHRRGGPRVFQAPVAMGARPAPLSEDQLNPMPLPFL
ncbi:TOMM precursor leader peptide-binding protein [Streptomyces cinnamoneus]|uniref:TOMM precursor leader peptide-binding protein n=1 Tax=Streptomyces cinnamoneus TaxID=53446 RepID=UPI0037930ED9